MRNMSLALLVLPIALPVAMAAQAQTNTRERAIALEEIVVTATRRETNLQDTAIAVSVFSGELMDDLNITNPESYEALVPSLTVVLHRTESRPS